MSLQELMRDRQARPAGSADGGRSTRLARFAQLVETAFGENPEALDMRLEDKGSGQSVEGHMSYNGQNFVLTYGNNSEGRGKWWFLDHNPFFKHQGRMSNQQSNLGMLLEALAGNQPHVTAQTTRLEEQE
jgi:hypothetical protein